MPSRHRVTLANSAVVDLENVRCWYLEQGVPEVGERVLREIVAAVEVLADFPESGRVVPEFGVATLREVIHSPFRIVYRVDAERVRIVRVWRGERLMRLP
jgi:plasmid stabilization system protein ParE